jgi:hypothetical protein
VNIIDELTRESLTIDVGRSITAEIPGRRGLLLFGYLATQPQQLRPLGKAERLITGSLDGLHASTFVAHPLAQ